jgi:hypothetical protein
VWDREVNPGGGWLGTTGAQQSDDRSEVERVLRMHVVYVSIDATNVYSCALS